MQNELEFIKRDVLEQNSYTAQNDTDITQQAEFENTEATLPQIKRIEFERNEEVLSDQT